jgi:hypothetical protein
MSPAPKGNKNAIGNEGGRPPFYELPEELQKACDKYFRDCKAEKIPVTITGLALHLGFSTRKSLSDYAEKLEFVNIIKKAKLKVECEYEKRLSGNLPTGAIFALKNMDWNDRTELTGADGRDINPIVKIEIIDTTDQVIKEDAGC